MKACPGCDEPTSAALLCEPCVVALLAGAASLVCGAVLFSLAVVLS